MSDTTSTKVTKLVWRRFSEPLDLYFFELPWYFWGVLLGVILFVAVFYVGWMYRKDSRGVGPWWATFLGTCRICVYGILATVFLLPGCQTSEKRELGSKAVVAFDVSLSVQGTRDDFPKPGQDPKSLPTRMDKLFAFMKQDKEAFLRELTRNNPVTAYRFGARLDEAFLQFDEDGFYFRDEYEEFTKPGVSKDDKPEAGEMKDEFWKAWLQPSMGTHVADEKWKPDVVARYDKMLKLNKAIGDSGVFRATNVNASVKAAFDREINNIVQGIVIFSDGHSTNFSQDALDQLQKDAERAKIPIFVVAIGAVRPNVEIEINSVRAPSIIRPDDKFRVAVEMTGRGLQNKQQPLTLEVSHVGIKKKSKDDPKGVEEALDLVLVERLDKKDSGREPVTVSLGKKPIVLSPEKPVQFSGDSVPRAEGEFVLDARSLADAAGFDLESDEKTRGRKWEIQPTIADPSGLNTSEIRLIAKTPKDDKEIFPEPFHLSRPVGLQVVQKELSILIFSSGPERDYRFLRTLLNREVQKGRAKLSIYLQKVPGQTEARPGRVQDVDPKRFLKNFPDRFDSTTEAQEDRVYDLAEYDVIIAFDPNWNELSPAQVSNLERWVDRGGGLIVVGGPINTLQLARPGAEKGKLKSLIELYPVSLEDVRVRTISRKTDKPWRLKLDQATAEMEFLRLKEDTGAGVTLGADWNEFYGEDKNSPSGVKRGFYRYYPVKKARTGAIVVARFTDPESKTVDGEQMPYLVLSDPASGRRVVWLGSGEMWRLRMYNEAYHERFWTKLTRYAGSGSRGRSNQRIRLYLSRVFKVNQFVRVEAKIDGMGDKPLPPNSKPKITLQLPAGVDPGDMETTMVMKPKPGGEGTFNAIFQARAPGEYKLQLDVEETNDTESRSFLVEEANPEVDDTRPQFDRLYELASDARTVLKRMSPGDQEIVRQALRGFTPTASEGEEKSKPRQTEEDVRLFFDLTNAHLIPKCMVSDPRKQTIPGPIKDIWDDGVEVWDRGPDEEPIKFSYVLIAVVGLLSIEWLTRKLLRLA